ncbi:hypothetical protein [Fulvivirga sediminis]|uniref:Uncharacterized protein n=1 Tax=Fulvivirga sediminis TaxID=2803949 RepID=A0A937K297_9BACT|nr:hypothetical protein [Fulvivirga sediminis]MBL3657567.1 hypothetical protein [Fulvivirga sediminis]
MKNLRNVMAIFVVLMLVACDSDDDSVDENLENNFIGTWRGESADYWYQFVFNEDLTGNRTDSDKEYDDFTYTFTADEIDFTTGFPEGKYDYKFLNDKTLVLYFYTDDPDTLIKQ